VYLFYSCTESQSLFYRSWIYIYKTFEFTCTGTGSFIVQFVGIALAVVDISSYRNYYFWFERYSTKLKVKLVDFGTYTDSFVNTAGV
jgi:hypothetical protein